MERPRPRQRRPQDARRLLDGRPLPGEPSGRAAVDDLIVRYPIAPGTDAELASGGQFSGHADFMNAWQQDGLRRLVDDCLNALRPCGPAP